MTRRVVLCADDYALTEGVSRGILELAAAGRISATSALTNMPDWPRLASALRPFRGRIGIGLHLNFTTGAPLGAMPRTAPDGRFPSLAPLLRSALARRLPMSEVRAEIEHQLDAFASALGAPPDFVDGHQHVHVLPRIRRALIEALAARHMQGRVWLRDPSDTLRAILRRKVSSRKALVVKGIALGFRAAARRAGFDTNEGFSGFSPLDPATPPQQVFRQALVALGPRPVLMAHPGYADETLRALDPAVESRPDELAYLGSSGFLSAMNENEIALTPSPTAGSAL